MPRTRPASLLLVGRARVPQTSSRCSYGARHPSQPVHLSHSPVADLAASRLSRCDVAVNRTGRRFLRSCPYGRRPRACDRCRSRRTTSGASSRRRRGIDDPGENGKPRHRPARARTRLRGGTGRRSGVASPPPPSSLLGWWHRVSGSAGKRSGTRTGPVPKTLMSQMMAIDTGAVRWRLPGPVQHAVVDDT